MTDDIAKVRERLRRDAYEEGLPDQAVLVWRADLRALLAHYEQMEQQGAELERLLSNAKDVIAMLIRDDVDAINEENRSAADRALGKEDGNG